MAKLYLLATNTKKPISRLITAVTGERFNHSSIAFSKNLAECFSYNMSENGFVVERKTVWPTWTEFELYSIEVTSAGLQRAKEFVHDAANAGRSFAYSSLMGVVINKPLPSDETRFCSQFVEEVCVTAGIKRRFLSPALATPHNVCRRPNTFLEARGVLHRYLVVTTPSRKFNLSNWSE